MSRAVAIFTSNFTPQNGCSLINSLSGNGGLSRPANAEWLALDPIHSFWLPGWTSRGPTTRPSRASENLCAASVPAGRRDGGESRAALAASVRSGRARAAYRRARSRVMRVSSGDGRRSRGRQSAATQSAEVEQHAGFIALRPAVIARKYVKDGARADLGAVPSSMPDIRPDTGYPVWPTWQLSVPPFTANGGGPCDKASGGVIS